MELDNGQVLNVHGFVQGVNSFNVYLTNCLLPLEIPLADTGSLTTGPSVDNQASFEIGRLRKPTWRICMFSTGVISGVECC